MSTTDSLGQLVARRIHCLDKGDGHAVGRESADRDEGYDELASAHIIINKRGQGYIVAPNGLELLHMLLITEFENEIIPELLKSMEMCGLSPAQVCKMLQSKFGNGSDIISAD